MDGDYDLGSSTDGAAPLDGVELQATDTCPRNYIIVDRTDSRSRIMFHPALAHKLGYHNTSRNERASSSHKDDSEEIDALMSLERESEEEDDLVSTGSNSPDTKKRERMKKMVKKLRGIIPGGERMDTPAVLDEAVKYLKSLKVEVKKLQSFKN